MQRVFLLSDLERSQCDLCVGSKVWPVPAERVFLDETSGRRRRAGFDGSAWLFFSRPTVCERGSCSGSHSHQRFQRRSSIQQIPSHAAGKSHISDYLHLKIYIIGCFCYVKTLTFLLRHEVCAPACSCQWWVKQILHLKCSIGSVFSCFFQLISAVLWSGWKGLVILCFNLAQGF